MSDHSETREMIDRFRESTTSSDDEVVSMPNQ